MWEQDIEKIKQEQKQQQKVVENSSRVLNSISEKIDENQFDFEVDIEGAKLSDVKKSSDQLNANIARMIFGLDKTTRGIDGSLSEMRSLTTFEKFINFFSKEKAQEMRSTRISESDISDNLQELIVQSDAILNILSDQEKLLIVERDRGNVNYEKTLDYRKQAVEELESVRNKMLSLDPIIIGIHNELDNETQAIERTRLERELSAKQAELNLLKNEEAKLLSKSQSLEKYIVQNKAHIQSLESQLTGQQVLIEKLKTDTDQRLVLFKQYEISLKTAQQQETAHQLNEIGTQVDKSAMEGMAQIGSATADRLAGMLEGHKGNMQATHDIARRQLAANEMFNRRFSNVLDDHESGKYDS